jgi:nicotinamidase-related amidase
VAVTKGNLTALGLSQFPDSYADFAARHDTLNRVAALLAHARSQAFFIVHLRIAFSPDYKEQPKESPLFKHASKLGALKLGDWGTEFLPQAAPLSGEAILTKHRVNAFIGTLFDLLLRNSGISRVVVVGCSTDVGVQTTARASHDLDYACTVIGDCCIAPSVAFPIYRHPRKEHPDEDTLRQWNT